MHTYIMHTKKSSVHTYLNTQYLTCLLCVCVCVCVCVRVCEGVCVFMFVCMSVSVHEHEGFDAGPC